jgi:hypothetical protein
MRRRGIFQGVTMSIHRRRMAIRRSNSLGPAIFSGVCITLFVGAIVVGIVHLLK